MMADWGGLVARLWCASKGLVVLRREVEDRPDLWRPFERFAEKAIRVERKKDHNADDLPWWIAEYDSGTFALDVQVAHRELSESGDCPGCAAGNRKGHYPGSGVREEET